MTKEEYWEGCQCGEAKKWVPGAGCGCAYCGHCGTCGKKAWPDWLQQIDLSKFAGVPGIRVNIPGKVEGDAANAAIETAVAKHGEQYRVIIRDSISWLITREPEWGVSVDREEFIDGLIERVAK